MSEVGRLSTTTPDQRTRLSANNSIIDSAVMVASCLALLALLPGSNCSPSKPSCTLQITVRVTPPRTYLNVTSNLGTRSSKISSYQRLLAESYRVVWLIPPQRSSAYDGPLPINDERSAINHRLRLGRFDRLIRACSRGHTQKTPTLHMLLPHFQCILFCQKSRSGPLADKSRLSDRILSLFQRAPRDILSRSCIKTVSEIP